MHVVAVVFVAVGFVAVLGLVVSSGDWTEEQPSGRPLRYEWEVRRWTMCLRMFCSSGAERQGWVERRRGVPTTTRRRRQRWRQRTRQTMAD